eukprot:GILK01015150.1.p1 GENE.GILK01015150.1~~GILK01015150.1.p1  ORF type:complete len:272 (+),score=33.32 GILK01015150.1:190-1005(+)
MTSEEPSLLPRPLRFGLIERTVPIVHFVQHEQPAPCFDFFEIHFPQGRMYCWAHDMFRFLGNDCFLLPLSFSQELSTIDFELRWRYYSPTTIDMKKRSNTTLTLTRVISRQWKQIEEYHYDTRLSAEFLSTFATAKPSTRLKIDRLAEGYCIEAYFTKHEDMNHFRSGTLAKLPLYSALENMACESARADLKYDKEGLLKLVHRFTLDKLERAYQITPWLSSALELPPTPPIHPPTLKLKKRLLDCSEAKKQKKKVRLASATSPHHRDRRT